MEAEAEAMALIEIVMIHFTLVLTITVLSLMETNTTGTTGVAMLVEVITHTNRVHTRHELPTKFRQGTRDMVALMVEWEGLAPPITMGVMAEILLTPGVAMLLQTPTMVVMGTVQHLVQITTTRTGMEKAVITADMEDTEGMARLRIPLVIHREVVL